MKLSRISVIALILSLAAGLGFSQSVELVGAGATFPAPIYSKLFDQYAKEFGVKVNYQAIGSGGGQSQLKNKTVDFGATDVVMLRGVLLCIGYIQRAVYVLNPKWSESNRDARIGERPGKVRQLDVLVKHVDCSRREIRRIQEITCCIRADCEPFVDGARNHGGSFRR